MSSEEGAPNHGPRVVLAIVAMCLLFGGSFVAGKSALASFTPAQLIFLRFSLAAGIFLAGVPLARPRWPGWKGVLTLVALAMLEPVLYFYLEAQGLRRITASTASILVSTIPLFVLGLEWAWFRIRVRLAEVLLFALSVAGIAILVTGSGRGVPAGEMVGNLLVLGAALAASLYTVSAKRFLKRHGTYVVTTVQCAWAGLFFLPFAAADTAAAPLSAIPPKAWFEAAFLGIGCSFLAYGFLNYSLARARAGFVAAFTNLIPVVSTTLAAVLLGERLRPQQIVGAGLVLACLAALTFLGMRARTT